MLHLFKRVPFFKRAAVRAVRVAVLNPGLDPLRASTPCPLHRPRPAPPQELAARDGRQGAARQPAEGRTWSREGRMAPESRRHADTRLQGYQEGGVVVSELLNFSHMHRSTQRSPRPPTSLASPPSLEAALALVPAEVEHHLGAPLHHEHLGEHLRGGFVGGGEGGAG